MPDETSFFSTSASSTGVENSQFLSWQFSRGVAPFLDRFRKMKEKYIPWHAYLSTSANLLVGIWCCSNLLIYLSFMQVNSRVTWKAREKLSSFSKYASRKWNYVYHIKNKSKFFFIGPAVYTVKVIRWRIRIWIWYHIRIHERITVTSKEILRKYDACKDLGTRLFATLKILLAVYSHFSPLLCRMGKNQNGSITG